jgi:REP element-mobilizing transposase RayT
MRKRMRQVEMRFPSWGGRRKGAGRRPNMPGKPMQSHLARPKFAQRFPQHVTIRMLPSVWNLRSKRCFSILQRAMWKGSSKEYGFKLVHFAVMGNHIHMLVEANGKEALSRGMQGLNIRIAKTLNRVMGRHGQVLSDHYNAKILKTPSQTIAARGYLLRNAKKHYGWQGPDPFASTVPMQIPRTWFLVTIERRPGALEAYLRARDAADAPRAEPGQARQERRRC